MEIEEISKVIVPLYDKLESYYPNENEFYYVGDCKALRIGTCADLLLNLQLEWSYDGEHKGVTTSCHIATMWRSSKIDIEMPYVRLRVVKNVPTPNKDLTISVMKWAKFERKRVSLPRDIPQDFPKSILKEIPEPLSLPPTSPVTLTKTEPVSVISLPTNQPVQSPRKHSKSPFSRFRKKSETPSPKSLPVRDPRIPEYLPKGAILFCGDSNSLKLLPRGLPNEVLMMGADGTPEWRMPYFGFHLDEESTKVLKEQGKLQEPESVDEIPAGWFDK